VTRADDDLLLVLHELRNPLVGIDAAARVLATELNGHPATSRARSIASEARHLLELLERVSEAEAISAGRVRSVRRPIDLAKVVRDTAAGFQRGREIVVSCPSEPVMVRADAGRIRQVLANLLMNAAQYSPTESPIDVTLRATRTAATVSVRDRGPGIPARERPRLFQKFSRLSTAEATRGSGLGLYICRSIIEEHGGTIGYREKTFSFTLPLNLKSKTRSRRSARRGDVEGGAGDLATGSGGAPPGRRTRNTRSRRGGQPGSETPSPPLGASPRRVLRKPAAR
jgi:signal transduction histidine kinase